MLHPKGYNFFVAYLCFLLIYNLCKAIIVDNFFRQSLLINHCSVRKHSYR